MVVHLSVAYTLAKINKNVIKPNVKILGEQIISSHLRITLSNKNVPEYTVKEAGKSIF